jgi:hypothetical protein
LISPPIARQSGEKLALDLIGRKIADQLTLGHLDAQLLRMCLHVLHLGDCKPGRFAGASADEVIKWAQLYCGA